MILARITRAIRTQNWFAVALEFVIVVAGVMLAFQATLWNEERRARDAERQALSQLHDELVQLTETREQFREAAETVSAQLDAARHFLHVGTSNEPMPEAMCNAIIFSHILPQPPDQMPTIEESIATGRLSAIRSPDLRASLNRFVQRRITARNAVEAIVRNSLLLPVRFPELLQRSLVADPDAPDGTRSVNSCDSASMRASASFLNELASNAGRAQAYVYGAIYSFDSDLAALHLALDAELGLTDAEEASE